MGWSEIEGRCRRHPKHRQSKGVCPSCLRERLSQLSASSSTHNSSTFCSPGSSYDSAAWSSAPSSSPGNPRDATAKIALLLKDNRENPLLGRAAQEPLTKSRSLAFVISNPLGGGKKEKARVGTEEEKKRKNKVDVGGEGQKEGEGEEEEEEKNKTKKKKKRGFWSKLAVGGKKRKEKDVLFHSKTRLEFLGDAVLDHLITVHLYNEYPNLSPGLLTDLRSASVNNDCYAHAAVKAGLNKQILHASSELHKQMGFYISNFTQSFSGSSYGWQAGSALPKVLADVIESIAGAIFVDSGFNKEAVWKSIRPLLEPLVTPETMKYHPVRELEELCSRKSYHKKFSTTDQGGIVSITVEVEVGGDTITATRTARNKKTAKKLAARAVLNSMRAGSAQPFLNAS